MKSYSLILASLAAGLSHSLNLTSQSLDDKSNLTFSDEEISEAVERYKPGIVAAVPTNYE